MYNILICDDEKDIINALKIYLNDPEYRFYEACNGKQVLEIIEREEIHLVLLDIMMPVMDGTETLAKLRQSFRSIHHRHHNIQKHQMNLFSFYNFQCLLALTGFIKLILRIIQIYF